LKQGSDSTGTFGCRHGYYAISFRHSGNTEIDHVHQGVSVDAEQVEAHGMQVSGLSTLFGVECVSDANADDAYQFVVAGQSDGYGIGKVTDGSIRVLKQAQSLSAGLKPGIRHVVATCRSTSGAVTLELSVDGKKRLSVTDHNGFASFEGMALYAVSLVGSGEVRFTDAACTSL
jgi:hypothetical protein